MPDAIFSLSAEWGSLEYPLLEAILSQTLSKVFTHATTRCDNTAIIVSHRVCTDTLEFGAGSALEAAADLQLATYASDRLLRLSK